jgi:hypothetical protein
MSSIDPDDNSRLCLADSCFARRRMTLLIRAITLSEVESG